MEHLVEYSAPDIHVLHVMVDLTLYVVCWLSCSGGHEEDSVFKGYKTRDRRKPHVVAADQQAADFLAQQLGETNAEGGPMSEGGGDSDGEMLGATAPSGPPGAIFDDDQFFGECTGNRLLRCCTQK